jgi:hypothetical protein
VRRAGKTRLHRSSGQIVARRDRRARMNQPDPQPVAAQAGAELVAEQVQESRFGQSRVDGDSREETVAAGSSRIVLAAAVMPGSMRRYAAGAAKSSQCEALSSSLGVNSIALRPRGPRRPRCANDRTCAGRRRRAPIRK